jgi:pimeloyl-ACP methyl ester carboxylesterase
MRTFVFASLVAAASLAGPVVPRAAAAARPVAPWGPAAVQACTQAGLSPCTLSTITRRQLTSDVAEYSFTMKIGSGAHDFIGLHRVINEAEGVVPVVTDNLFLVHGDILGFDGAFLASAASPTTPDSHALPVYLAERGIDVWGLDMRWVLVPGNTSDFTFMQSWGLAMNAGDVGAGLAIAAGVRGSNEKMNLLGWSRGGQVGYVYLSSEGALAANQRRVKGFIQMDIYARTDDPTLRQYACDRLEDRQDAFDDGLYYDSIGQFAGTLGAFALANPNAVSPFAQTPSQPNNPFPPGTTNRQAALLVGEATFGLLAPTPPTATYHWVGGTFDGNGMPNGLTFTNETFFYDFLTTGSPFEPTKLILDAEAMMCENTDTPFLDNLAQVDVPVLYVGASGGFGATGIYSTTLLGSTDVESLVVDPTPAAPSLLDFGHADLVTGADAETLVWSPIYDWIRGIRQQ